MSNYLAIATVTAVLQRILQSNLQIDVDGARVTTLRPDKVGNATPETGVNVYLYDILLNIARRNSEFALRHIEQGDARRAHVALDAYYLITCYGNDAELEPQRLLGSVFRTFVSNPKITPEMIQETLADPLYSYLSGANLAEQDDMLSILPVDLSVTELSKIWSVFYQVPYSLSVAYKVSVVTVESEMVPKKSLPVRGQARRVVPHLPVVEKIMVVEEHFKRFWQGDNNQSALPTSTLIIRGQQLLSDQTVVRVGEAKTVARDVGPKQVNVLLSQFPANSLRPGVQTVQVIHPQRGVESNAMALMLLPVITQVSLENVAGLGESHRSADVVLEVAPSIGRHQRVVLVLNELSVENPIGYTFDASPRSEDGSSLVVPIREVEPGEYLVRIQVDGAESLLEVDTDEDSPTVNQYIGPLLLVV